WDERGLTLHGHATAGGGLVNLGFDGAYQDSSNWSVAATGTAGTGAPAGVDMSKASNVAGSVVDVGGTITFDVKADLVGPWSPSSVVTINGLTAELSDAI